MKYLAKYRAMSRSLPSLSDLDIGDVTAKSDVWGSHSQCFAPNDNRHDKRER
tara:strand:+ start:625 stop:780 length:156 start_codon:yes stop_codon:yes gene_type:complete